MKAGRGDPAKAPHHPGRALFGGWRIDDLAAQREERAPGPCGGEPEA